MEATDLIITAVGLGAIGFGIYYIWKKKKEVGEGLVIQYWGDGDKPAAELIQKTVGGKLYKGFIDPYTLKTDLVIVGGQQINPTYAILEGIHVLPTITEEDHCHRVITFVPSWQGHRVWGVASWFTEDTYASAEWIAQHGGLPMQNVREKYC